jgi:hypothetical protein
VNQGCITRERSRRIGVLLAIGKHGRTVASQLLPDRWSLVEKHDVPVNNNRGPASSKICFPPAETTQLRAVNDRKGHFE